MDLKKAFRAQNTDIIAFSGAGGKTSAIFNLARCFQKTTLVTTTTHLGIHQAALADRFIEVKENEPFSKIELSDNEGVVLVAGVEADQKKIISPGKKGLDFLHKFAIEHQIPLLIEADGSRQLAIKAPDQHEPAIPDFVNKVIVCAGLSVLGKEINNRNVHRPELFCELTGKKMGEIIDESCLAQLLNLPGGGLKGIPDGVSRTLLLNQADTAEIQARAQKIAKVSRANFNQVVICSLQPEPVVFGVFEKITAVLLAGGGSSRFGKPKVLITWQGKPFIRIVVETILSSDFWEIIVVTGAEEEPIRNALHGLPVKIISNPAWAEGQSTSIRAGVSTTSPNTGAIIFVLADQPQVPGTILNSLIENHRQTLNPIIAPLIEDRRGNPVLFDQVTFSELLKLEGDMGGRGVFKYFPISYIPWVDGDLLIDIDTPEDYRHFLEKFSHG